MSKRLEAAVKAWDRHWGDRYGDEALEEMGKEVQVALDAADAVMFSEDAVERAARAEYESDMENLPGGFMQPWDEVGETQEHYKRGVRAVIASLRGDA